MELREMGIPCASFQHSRLPAKTATATLPMRIVAECPLREEDLEGSTISGRGIRALLRAVGLDLNCIAPVPWRNMRDEVGGCWRRHDDSGCQPPDCVESAIAVTIDAIYNIAVWRAGYLITTVIAASATVQAAEVPPGAHPEHPGPHVPRDDCCYPSETRVFVCDHLKFLTGMGANPGKVAAMNVMAVCKAIAHFFASTGAGDIEVPKAVSLYGAVQASPYFRSRLVHAEAFTNQKRFKEAVKAMKSELAQINAVQCTIMDCLCVGSKASAQPCTCRDHTHSSSSSRGGEESVKAKKKLKATKPGFKNRHQQDCSAGGEVSRNRGNDRGRSGEGGAKVWSLVLYEIAQKHLDSKKPSDRFFEHCVHAINNGMNDGEGSEVRKDNSCRTQE